MHTTAAIAKFKADPAILALAPVFHKWYSSHALKLTIPFADCARVRAIAEQHGLTFDIGRFYHRSGRQLCQGIVKAPV